MIELSPRYLFRTNVRTMALAERLAPLMNDMMSDYIIYMTKGKI